METQSLLADSRIAGASLPEGVLAQIHGARSGFTTGALLLPGLPIGEIPATPRTAAAMVKPDRTSERTLLGVASLLGEPIGYAQEHGGDVVQNLFPLASSVGRQLSTSSGVELAFHTETAFHPHKPAFLLLLCLRGDIAAATTLCTAADIAAQLSATTLATLSEPRFRCGVDESVGSGTAWLTDPMPIFAADGVMTFDGELTIGTDVEAEEALHEVRTAIGRARTSVTLAAGDLLVVDNRRAVHGRSPFTARFDGTDRWLQRTFVVDKLPPAIERNGRVISTRFA